MTAAEQQLLFEKTRARIQGNLTAVAELAQTCLDPKEFFPQFLRLAINSLAAEGGVVWVQKGEAFERVAEVNFSSSQYDENVAQRTTIDGVLAEVARGRRPHIIPAAGSARGPANSTPFPYFFAPIVADEKLLLILQVWLKEAGDPKTYHDIAAFLVSWSAHGVTFLRNHQRALIALKNEELAQLIRMQASLLGELDPKEVSSLIVNYASDILRSDLACLFARRGKGWKMIAASNQEVIDDKSQQTRRLTAFIEGLEPAEQAKTFSVESAPEAAEKFEGTGYQQIVWRLIKQPGMHADFLLCGFRHEGGTFAANAPDLLNRVAESAGKSLDAAHHYHALPLRPVLGRVAKVVNDWRGNRRKKLLVTSVVLAVAGIILFAIPVPLKITADCTVEPVFRAMAVAEAAGKISSVYVEEGQHVNQGDLLAKLEDDDYVTQLAVSEQQKLRWQVEAARAQNEGQEAERKLAEINAQREIEAIKRYEYLRARTEIRSPITGTILTKNLHNREGEPLQLGGAFCEVAGSSDYELELKIKQNDIGDLLNALNSRGELPMDFILHSHARYHLSAVIENSHHVSQLPEIQKDHSTFIVKVPFPEGTPISDKLKPGYTGKAKIRIGTSNLFYSWFRPFFNYWRVEWGV